MNRYFPTSRRTFLKAAGVAIDASRHSNRDLPIILAGGSFKHGQHVNARQRTGTLTPLNNLYTTMLQEFGVEIDRFNNATGTVEL